MAKKHCSNGTQMCCTFCYAVCWVLLLIGVALYHAGIAKMVPPLQDLQKNLKTGFYVVLKFDKLDSEIAVLKNQASKALKKCGVSSGASEAELRAQQATTTCTDVMAGNLNSVGANRTANTKSEKKEIMASINRALSPIRKIGNDPFLGLPDLKANVKNIDDIEAKLARVDSERGGCLAQSVEYCGIYDSAVMLDTNAAASRTAIDSLIYNKVANEYTENGDKLQGLHLLPYVLVLSAGFFTCFWYKDGTCCCCKGGSFAGCVFFLIPHALLWWVFLVVNTILLALGGIMTFAQDSIPIEGVLAKDTNMKDFTSHISTTYTGFWDVVFTDLVAGLELFFRATVAFEIFSLVIVFYGCCMCCIKPYADEETKTVDSSVVNR